MNLRKFLLQLVANRMNDISPLSCILFWFLEKDFMAFRGSFEGPPRSELMKTR